MVIPVFSVEDLEDVRRLPERIQLVSDPTLPIFFFVVGGGSRFFFINLAKWIDSISGKIDIEAVETEEDLPKKIIKIDAATPFTYYGFADPTSTTAQAAWRILREEDLGAGDSDFLYADGDDSFDNVWDDRTTLSYS